jgi:bifunctional enzyme CysN/CysC
MHDVSTRTDVKIVVVGHVDHGKSTLIGRLLYETGNLSPAVIDSLAKASDRRGASLEWSFALDALQVERNQGITLDTTRIFLKSRAVNYVIIDAPGHLELLRNMLSGAADADAAVLVIDTEESVREQSRRHAYLLRLIGLRQVAVAVNKMDAVGYSRDRFSEIKSEISTYLGELGLAALHVVPISARHGDNLTTRSPHMPWYDGLTLLDALEAFTPPTPFADRPLRLPIQDVYRHGNRRILVGRVESGSVRVGDALLFSPSNCTARIRTIETWNGASSAVTAVADQVVGFTLDDHLALERGEIASHLDEAPKLTDVFGATMFWVGDKALTPGMLLKLNLATSQTTAIVHAIRGTIDVDTRSLQAADVVQRNQVADIVLRTNRMLALDDHHNLPRTGRFVLSDGFDTVGGGIVASEEYPDLRQVAKIKATNVTRVGHLLTPAMRAWRNGHRGAVIWLTGLSGAGKSTLAMRLEERLFDRGFQTYVLDGDNVRRSVNSDLGFSPEERAENMRRVGGIAALFADAGLIVITALISPYRADRERARNAAGQTFHEIYVKADVDTCERRDPRGLYRKARAGEIAEFTGISAPYEAPERPELVIDTVEQDIDHCVAQLLDYVERHTAATGRQAERAHELCVSQQPAPGGAQSLVAAGVSRGGMHGTASA